jgi:hypothetical protein
MNRMNCSRNDMILRLLEPPRTTFSIKEVTLLTNVEWGGANDSASKLFCSLKAVAESEKGYYGLLFDEAMKYDGPILVCGSWCRRA